MRQWTISWWQKICVSIITIPVNLFVRSKPIPTHPVEELHIDLNRPILYVLPCKSKIDLMVIRQLANRFQLPDPLLDITVNGNIYPSFVFIDSGPGKPISGQQKQHRLSILNDLIIEHKKNTKFDIQILPVTVMFNRKPSKDNKAKKTFQILGNLNKFSRMLFSGYDCYIRFSRAFLLKNLVKTDENIQQLDHKLARSARIYFTKQRLAAVGPKLVSHRSMINQLLNSAALTEAILEEAKSKETSIEEARKNALAMLNEISAKFTYWALRITDLILTWAWSHLYQGLKIHNANSVRQLAENGHEIVYAPCHRSHMDYLLLSYVLYRQGLAAPHITAGINLNFWPAGPIFRRLGAFFIRRSFKGNKLYTAVFREYLAELFIRGYSVEYFIEGGRSRTGRLLDPKTGMLMMTIQTMLRGDPRPITIIPIYIGYEHVLEVATYANELRGAAKQKESLWQAIKAFCKLKKLGYGYVNFGESIPLNQFLNYHIPNWREAIHPIEPQRPNWLTPTTNQLAIHIMENINRAAAVNPMNLCCAILLAAKNNTLPTKQLLAQINYLLALFRHVPYDTLVTIPDKDAGSLFDHARQMNKFTITGHSDNETVSLPQKQVILMTYYRNNIQHLLIIPALIARIIINRHTVSRSDLILQIKQLYPFIKAELFVYHQGDKLIDYVNHLINELIQLVLIKEENNQLSAIPKKKINLSLLAANADDSLERYAIVFSLLCKNPTINRSDLKKEARKIAEQLSVSHGIDSPEFSDKNVFATLINTLREQDYLNNKDANTKIRITQVYTTLVPLISQSVRQMISDKIP